MAQAQGRAHGGLDATQLVEPPTPQKQEQQQPQQQCPSALWITTGDGVAEAAIGWSLGGFADLPDEVPSPVFELGGQQVSSGAGNGGGMEGAYVVGACAGARG